jgi:hypothetical protein
MQILPDKIRYYAVQCRISLLAFSLVGGKMTVDKLKIMS